jgi:glutamate-5-semialdehyde dehydrogenase
MTVADATAEMDIHEEMLRLGHGARDAARVLAKADTETKNTALRRAAAAIREDSPLILAANGRDMEAARAWRWMRGVSRPWPKG